MSLEQMVTTGPTYTKDILLIHRTSLQQRTYKPRAAILLAAVDRQLLNIHMYTEFRARDTVIQQHREFHYYKTTHKRSWLTL